MARDRGPIANAVRCAWRTVPTADHALKPDRSNGTERVSRLNSWSGGAGARVDRQLVSRRHNSGRRPVSILRESLRSRTHADNLRTPTRHPRPTSHPHAALVGRLAEEKARCSLLVSDVGLVKTALAVRTAIRRSLSRMRQACSNRSGVRIAIFRAYTKSSTRRDSCCKKVLELARQCAIGRRVDSKSLQTGRPR